MHEIPGRAAGGPRALPYSCRFCRLSSLCQAGTWDAGGDCQPVIRHGVALPRDAVLFREGERFRSLYIVFSGALKTFTCCLDGNQQIIGFYLSGELVGMDGVHTGAHGCSAVALGATSVCEIRFARLEALAPRVPGLLHQMLCMMSAEILHDEEAMLLLGKKTADERLASLLLNLARRLHDRGYSPREFRLPMSRDDIANYLGLAHETVSRLFTRFQRHGYITVRGRNLRIDNLDQLEILAGAGHEAHDARVRRRSS